jgi:hypothetical protein
MNKFIFSDIDFAFETQREGEQEGTIVRNSTMEKYANQPRPVVKGGWGRCRNKQRGLSCREARRSVCSQTRQLRKLN